MKRLFLLILIFLILPLRVDVFGAAEAGRFLAVKRDVYLLREGLKKDAEVSMPFRTKDEVETGRRSRAKLLFVDDSVYNLGE
ncbi:MAG: hypothetical protein D6726_06835, partial [Nitrospirae bacterium]